MTSIPPPPSQPENIPPQTNTLQVCMTLFVVEHGETLEEPGYIVRFLTSDRPSMARLGGLLFSMPEGRARHLMNNVWWVHEDTMVQLVEYIPALGIQISQLASGDQRL
jgi:hypothetical protein